MRSSAPAADLLSILVQEVCGALTRGGVLVPVLPRSKRPSVPWRDRAPFSEPELLWYVSRGHGAAMRTGAREGYADHPCGGGSGTVVIDVDHHRGAALDPSWPETWSVRTPGDGLHLIHAWNGPDDIPSRTDALRMGIDVRARGGIALLPGCQHPNGGIYRWETDRSPDDLPLAPLPDALAAKLRERPLPPIAPPPPCVEQWVREGRFAPYAEAAFERGLAAVAGASRGSRNDTLYRQCWGLARIVGAGLLDPEGVAEAMLVAAAGTGLPQREARATIRSAMRAGASRPIDLVLLDARRGMFLRRKRRRRNR